MKNNEITVLTFATFGGNYGERDYSRQLAKMKSRCEELGLDLKVASFTGLDSNSVDFEIDRMFPMRKGAGYWFWKPVIISKAADIVRTRYILYLDSDLHLNFHPKIPESSEFKELGLSAFETAESLLDWSSKRCLKFFGLDKNSQARIVSASFIFFDTQNEKAKSAIRLWESMVRQPKLLLDPFWTFKRSHRHDQTILSCLISSGKISLAKLYNGFYQTGVDNRNIIAEDAWLVHGTLEPKMEKPIIKSFQSIRSLIFHKLDLAKFWIGILLRKFLENNRGLPNESS